MGRHRAFVDDPSRAGLYVQHSFHFDIAQLHIRRGDPERALQAWERALQANPNLEGGPQVLQMLEDVVQRRAGSRT